MNLSYSKRMVLWCAILNAMIIELSTETYVTALSIMRHEFVVSQAAIGLTISSNLIGLTVAGLIFGPISDRIGRKKIIVYGLLVFIVSTVACYLSKSFIAILIARSAQGIGGGVAMIVSSAMMRDSYSGKELAKALSFLSTVLSIAPGLGPICGALIINQTNNWRTPFIMILLVGIAVLLFTLITKEPYSPHEKDHRVIPANIIKSYIDIFKNKEFMYFTVAQALIIALIWAEVSNMPLIFIEGLGVSQIDYAYIQALLVLVYIAGTITNRTMVDYFKIETIILIGITVLIISSVALYGMYFFMIPSAFAITVVKIPGSFALAMIISNACTLALRNVIYNRGTATALMESTQTLFGGVLSYIIGKFYNGTMHPISLSAILICIITTIIILKNTYPKKSSIEPNADNVEIDIEGEI